LAATLPDEDAVPPTQRDEGVPPTQLDPPPRRRRWVWVLLVTFALLAGAATYLYLVVLRPEPTAHRHVPAGTSIALRADALKILVWKPVRQHLWPLAFDTAEGEEPADSRRARLIQEKTGVRIPADFREVIVASVDGVSWVAIVGGTIEPGRFVKGVDEVLRTEGINGWKLDGDVLVHELGPSIGQAEDGTILVGTDVRMVRAALPASDDEEAEALPLPRDEALSFMVHARAYRGMVSQLPLTLPGLDALERVQQVQGTVALSDEPRLSIEAQPKDGVVAEALAKDFEAAVFKLRLASVLISADLYGAKQALSDLKIRAEGKQVLLEAPWPYDDLDRAVRQLAEAIKAGRTVTR
jgi:hypothetical protein